MACTVSNCSESTGDEADGGDKVWGSGVLEELGGDRGVQKGQGVLEALGGSGDNQEEQTEGQRSLEVLKLSLLLLKTEAPALPQHIHVEVGAHLGIEGSPSYSTSRLVPFGPQSIGGGS